MDGIFAFILIVYIGGYKQGGPLAVEFNDKPACEFAIRKIKSSLEPPAKDAGFFARPEPPPLVSSNIPFALCIPKSS